MALNEAIEFVAARVEAGWRPSQLPPVGNVHIYLRIQRGRKTALERLAAKAKITFVDLARVAGWSALQQMEAGDQVMWPFRFTDEELSIAIDASRT